MNDQKNLNLAGETIRLVLDNLILDVMNIKYKPSFDYDRIRQFRELRNLSQDTVAKYLDISQSSYNDIEQGRATLYADMLPLLAQCLQLDIRCFFENDISCQDHLILLHQKKELERTYAQLRLEKEKLLTQLKEKKQRDNR